MLLNQQTLLILLFYIPDTCTENMVSESVYLDDVKPISSSVKFGNNAILKAAHVGKLKTDPLILSDVLMVSGLTRNLISAGKLDDKGCSIHTTRK